MRIIKKADQEESDTMSEKLHLLNAFLGEGNRIGIR